MTFFTGIIVCTLLHSAVALRHEKLWTSLNLTSKYANQIHENLRNCSLSPTRHAMNNYGLGSDIHTWSQAVCNGMEDGVRVTTAIPDYVKKKKWIWQSTADCEQNVEPLKCYFNIPSCNDPPNDLNVTAKWHNGSCNTILGGNHVMFFRAAATEFLFTRVSHAVINEAKRQEELVFGASGAPPDLITVHIRWGDKGSEMELQSVFEYISAVKNISLSSDARVYISTEDPAAIDAFIQHAPSEWKIYQDQMVNDMKGYRPQTGNNAVTAALRSEGREGIEALASLLLAMESQKFIITGKSNWSRLMDEIRKNILDPHCNYCTSVIDLEPASWQ